MLANGSQSLAISIVRETSQNSLSAAAGKFMLALAFSFLLSIIGLASSSAPTAAQSSSAKPTVEHSMATNGPRLQLYLRRLFGNSQIRVVQQPNESLKADLLLGGKKIGAAEMEEGGDFIVEMEFPSAEMMVDGKPDAARMQSALQSIFGTQGLRVQRDGVEFEVLNGKESIGSIDVSPDAASLMLVVMEDDMPAAPQTLIAQIEPVDAANATFFVARNGVPVREAPLESAPAVAELREDQQIKVIGKTKTSAQAKARWFQVEFADGKPRYVLASDLLGPREKEAKSRYRLLDGRYVRFLDQINISQGPLARYMGFYTLGRECELRPRKIPEVLASKVAQRVEDLRWAVSAWTIWSDGNQIFRARVDSGDIARFKPTHLRNMKTKDLGEVRFYRLDRIEPPGLDDDFAITGFAENGKLLIGVQFDGDRFKYYATTRCGDIPAVRSALTDFYKGAIANLPEPR